MKFKLFLIILIFFFLQSCNNEEKKKEEELARIEALKKKKEQEKLRKFKIIEAKKEEELKKNVRWQTINARKITGIAFDIFGKEVDMIFNELKSTRNRILHKMQRMDTIDVDFEEYSMSLSNEVDTSICKVYAQRVSKLKSKVDDIEDASSIYFDKLDSLHNVIKIEKIHKSIGNDITAIKIEYKKSYEKALKTIEKAEKKYEEICYYREIIIIVSTINSIREKISELNKITDEALKIIQELDNFAKNGKKIIKNPI